MVPHFPLIGPGLPSRWFHYLPWLPSLPLLLLMTIINLSSHCWNTPGILLLLIFLPPQEHGPPFPSHDRVSLHNVA